MLGARRVTRAIIIAVLLSLLPVQAASASHNKTRLEQTRREIRATRARLSTVLRSDAEVMAALNAVTAQLRTHQAHLTAARAHLSRIDLGIRAQQRRLRALDTKADARRAAIAGRARALYMMGAANTIQALTDASSIEEFVGRAGAIEFVTSSDRRTVEDLRAAEYDAVRERRALQAKRVEAAEVRDEIAGRVEVVAEAAAAKQDVHDSLSGRISSYRSEIAALEREQSRVIALIRARASTSRGPVSRAGFIWPTSARRISSPYGPRWGGFHTGMDIDCDMGDAIWAAKAGRVIESGWGGGYGNMIIIDHGNGVSTLYAHMSRLYVGGGSVAQRKTIGACGSTGNSTGSHLHIEVRINGNHTNPDPYLP